MNATTSAARSPRASASKITPENCTDLEFPVRRMEFPLDFDFASAFPGKPGVTVFLTVLSLAFPDGEQFFVDSVNHYRKRITDKKLSRQVKAFIGQEAQHGLQHRKYNEKMASQIMSEKRARLVMKTIRQSLEFAQKVLPPKTQLAITAAAEHLTAMLADQMLRNPAVRSGANPEHIELWMWHAVEETEHKGVAFDVYRHVGGGYVRRVTALAAMTAVALPGLFAATASIMAGKGLLFSAKDWRTLLDWLLGRDGLLSGTLPLYFQYYRPGFHPWDHDNSDLVAAWKAEQSAAPAHA